MSQNASRKIGISFSPYGHTYGADKYVKLKEQGYDAVDYNLANTDTAVYAMDERRLQAAMEGERRAAAQAEVGVLNSALLYNSIQRKQERFFLCNRGKCFTRGVLFGEKLIYNSSQSIYVTSSGNFVGS